eukprot:550857-Prymnesium_polylepis.1
MDGVMAIAAARRADEWMEIMDDAMAQSTTSTRALDSVFPCFAPLRRPRDDAFDIDVVGSIGHRVYHSSYNLKRAGHMEKVEAIID